MPVLSGLLVKNAVCGGLQLESFLMDDSSGILERERSFLLQTYNRYPVVLARGKGVFLYDLEGRRYLDFVAGLGVNALGHAHPRVVKIIREQAARAIHLSNLYYNEYQGRLAEKLCGLSGLQRAFFSNAARKQLKDPSSWLGWQDIGAVATAKAN